MLTFLTNFLCIEEHSTQGLIVFNLTKPDCGGSVTVKGLDLEDKVMNKHSLLAVAFVLAIPGSLFGPALCKVEGAIVYSGSQNVTLTLQGGMSPPAEMEMISIAGSGEKWDDFTIILEYEMERGMTGMPHLAIYAPIGTSPTGMMSMSGVVGAFDMGSQVPYALNLAAGEEIGPRSLLVGWASLYDWGVGQFDEEGGYIGLMIDMPGGSPHYAWVRLSNMSNVGENDQSVTFNGWAYEDVAGIPIGAGDTGPGPGPCGWQSGDPHKMHFPQLPDPQGWDVDVTYANILADDWKCSATDPIEDIHFWYSWLGDKVGTITNIRASIWSNIPADGKPGSYSQPGKVLWERDFNPDQFQTCYWGSGNQGFMMGNEGRANDHKQIFQCNIVNVPEPYVQQQGRIYWLAISVLIRDPVGTHIGWKTSKDHFEDDAVHGSPDGLWQEMRDPLTRQSLDLAFVITGQVQPEEPKCDLGDAPDSSNTAGVPMTAYPKGGPLGVQANYPTVYRIGSPPCGPVHWQPKAVAYLGNGVSLENEADIGPDEDGTNNIDPRNDSPDLDKADDGVAVPLVLPHCELTSFDYRVTVVPLATIEPPPLYVNVWFDWNRDGDWNDVLQCPDGTMVPEWAVQNQLLQFVTSGTYNVTTPAFTCWHPPGVQAEDPIWMRITLSEQQWGMVLSAAGAGGDGPAAGYEFGETEDYYFVPGVEVPPEPKPPAEHLKWSQPPVEWDPMDSTSSPQVSKTPIYCGWNEPSFCVRPSATTAVLPTVWQIVADDFRCLGNMPVTSVHWWGSYEGWDGREPPDTRPIAWQIGFWSNVAANPDAKPAFSHPGKLLWQVEIPAERVHEEWAGIDRFAQKPSDTCFQHYVQLKPGEYFWQNPRLAPAPVAGGDIYWISITAIYPPILIPFHIWGWKTRPQHWMDDAVRFEVQGELPTDFSNEFGIEELTSTFCGEKQSYDMAFELDTDPNYIKWEQAYTGIRDWPHYEDEESLAIETTTAIKWTQKPDLSETGMDVDATDDIPPTWPLQVLADDFKCTATGPITHIRLWGSWYNDILPARFPENVVFKLSIYEDIPAGQSLTRHSMPGKLLWSRDFKSGQFDAAKYAEKLKEGWYVPCKPIYEPSADTVCRQFDFGIDQSEAFIQQQGTIYWLAVQAQVVHAPMSEATRFGWKTSADHWNDDAVWRTEIMPISRPWEEMRYPQRHPLEGKSVDLAFEITSETQKEQLQIRRLVADDWLCTRITPVTAVVWWGSYIGYQYEACQCQQMTPPAKPDYFLLSIWSDVPPSLSSTEDTGADVGYSHPGEKLWEYKAYDYDEVLVGYDKQPEISSLDISFPSAGREPVFRYSVRLPQEEWFCQKDVNGVYWLSIAAVYKNPQEARYPWGWTNHKCTAWEPPGLTEVLHWNLDETAGVTARDDSGNNNHGTLVGDAKWAACCGHVCGALDLDGKGDYVKVDTPTGLNFAPGSFSASAWVRAREVTGGWRTIMEYDRDGWDRNRFGMWLTDEGRFHFRVGWNAWQTNQKLNADQWYMLTGTYDSKTKKFSMYVNGQFDIAADLQKGFTSANVAKLTVGVRGSEDGEYFNGLIDDVRIYSYALSAHEVKALYDGSRNDAVAGHMVTDPTGASTWGWEELRDQLGMSEDMSFILFTEPGCFPCTYSTYGDWLAFGKPDCWCAPPNGSGYQCDGDADGKDSGGLTKYRVYTGDLNLIVANWRKKAGDAGLDPCADVDHKDSGGLTKYRVFTGDLTRLVTNWKKKDAQLPGDCPRPE
jgi:hypothetical protein